MTSEHAFDEQEARRLIETALGAEDRFAGLVERAEQSATAFATAADAYVRDDLEGSSAALAEYTNHANTHAQGCYDLCCAGAAATAALFAGISGECGHVECGVRLDSVDAPDLMTRWAIDCVNAAADKRPDLLGMTLNMVYGLIGADGLHLMTTVFVDLYARVSRLVAD